MTDRPHDSSAATTPRSFDDTFRELLAEPWAFEFFQAVHLLERFTPNRAAVGGFADPRAEVVRFRTAVSTAFPASEIAAFDPPDEEGDPPRMTVNFMGLTGPQGILPLVYSAYLAERERVGDHAIKDFFGMFDHRVLSLFYRAWARAHAAAHDNGDGWLTRHLLDLIGLGTDGLGGRLPMSDDGLLFYAGLLGLPTRPAIALEQLVGDYFGVPVRVEQFVGGWYPLETSTQCELGEDGGPSAQLGMGAVAGDETWDQQSRVRLRLGPLSRAQYDDFLPGGSAHEPMRALTRFFGDDQLDFELQLVLDRAEVPGVRLGMDGAESAPLGWCTWLRTSPLGCDPDDTVFTL